METTQNIWVLGGDRRQRELAHLLTLDGAEVHTFALPGDIPGTISEQALFPMSAADCVILPLPVSRDSRTLNAPLCSYPPTVAAVFDAAPTQTPVFGGMVTPEVQTLAIQRNLTLLDYFAREELAIANAVPTAEGALRLALEHLPITIHGARILILGYGRVARVTAQRFAALGAHVQIAARNAEQLAWAEVAGHSPIPLSRLWEALPYCDLLINTIPARILDTADLSVLRGNCPILELASAPGGTDPEEAAKLNRLLIPAPGLPGKTAPVTAALAIKNTIYHMLRELGQRPGKDVYGT